MTLAEIEALVVEAVNGAFADARREGADTDWLGRRTQESFVALVRDGQWIVAGDLLDRGTDPRWDHLRAYILGLAHGRAHTTCVVIANRQRSDREATE